MDAVEAMEQAIISGVTHDTGEAKVTIERVPDRPGIAAKMFETMATEGINIEMISTSTIRISCVVAEEDVERAVQSLHAAFGLDKE